MLPLILYHVCILPSLSLLLHILLPAHPYSQHVMPSTSLLYLPSSLSSALKVPSCTLGLTAQDLRSSLEQLVPCLLSCMLLAVPCASPVHCLTMVASPCWAAEPHHTALSLPLLKGRGRENTRQRAQGLTQGQGDHSPLGAKQIQCREINVIYCILLTD